MTLHEYIHSLKTKRITVIGAGISNRPLIKLLCSAGIDVTVCDRSEQLHPELQGLALHTQLGESYLDHLDADIIFRTPGLHPNTPALCGARSKGCEVTSEMELFLKLCPCKVIAVTGSDGKTTTTSLIASLLNAAGYHVHLGGNIGHPLLCEVDNIKREDIAVLELSSFQLHSMYLCPDIAVVTNISPNHLDIHPSYQDYIDAKKQVFRHQTSGGILVVNEDNDTAASCAAEANGAVRSFSRKHCVENGFYCENGWIVHAQSGAHQELMPTKNVSLPGVHNLENILASFTAVSDLVDGKTMTEVAQSFSGVAHRLETVRVHRGVTFINDSIASSPGRTIAGLNCFDKKLILIAGGKDKGVSFDELGPVICRHVKSLYLTGLTADKILNAVEKASESIGEKPSVHIIEDFRDTVLAAAQEAQEGDIVLLSPASTSFDKFKNFEERGNTFRKIVEEL